MTEHDYTAKGVKNTHTAVRLVVKPGETYGSARSGEVVVVDRSELRNQSTMSACMPVEDYAKLLAEQEEKARLAAMPPPPSSISAVVEAGLARIREDAMAEARKHMELVSASAKAAWAGDVPAQEGELYGKKE